MEKEINDYKFEVTTPAKITIKNIRGLIDVKQGSESEIKVQVIKYPDTGNAEETQFSVHQESNKKVCAEVTFDTDGFFKVRKPCRLDFIVEVPADCTVVAKNVSGNIDLVGVNGNHRLKTVSGNVSASEVTGSDVVMKSVSGKITGSGIKSDTTEATSVSGSVKLSEMKVDQLDVSTVSGSIKYIGALGAGRHDLGSVSGSIKLTIPEDSNLDIKASSISGKLNSNLPIKYTSLSKTRWIGTLNDGGNPMKLKTVSGSMGINVNE